MGRETLTDSTTIFFFFCFAVFLLNGLLNRSSVWTVRGLPCSDPDCSGLEMKFWKIVAPAVFAFF